ncbi:MAG: NAD(P)H-dependent glycerol-3-phosphate dehydrogenase [Planctomycetota bacterium]
MSALVLGSGTWGTALAIVLARAGRPVTLLCRRSEVADAIRGGTHPSFPGLALPPMEARVFGEPVEDARFVISTVPTQKLRGVLAEHGASLPRAVPWVSGSKGLEIGTQRLPTEIIREAGVEAEVGILSGPSHAEEVVLGVPTAVSLAVRDAEIGRWLQEAISDSSFRVYTNNDTVGVEWGGVLKNVVALASGIAIGLGFGDNTIAALVSRGAAEISRLGADLGGHRETFFGLSGVGDLVVTCFSEHSRNRAYGVRLGAGEDPRALLEDTRSVVEGVHTSRAVHELRQQHEIDMPIAEEVFRIVHEGRDPQRGVEALLARELREE